MLKTSSALDRVALARQGGKVERCHAIPHLGSYSNASHQWGVAMLMSELWPEDFPRLALACLSHDVPERWVGDIPAPVLRASPEIKALVGTIEDGIFDWLSLPRESGLAPEDHAKLKACDRLELYLWAQEQTFLGNRYGEECMLALDEMFDRDKLPHPADKLYMEIRLAYDSPRAGRGVVREILASQKGER